MAGALRSGAGRVWLLCTAGLVAAILAAMVFVGETPRTTSDLAEGVRAQLHDRIVTILEADSDPDSVCAASVFGVAPRTARTADDVETAYAWVLCKWPLSDSRSAAPSDYSAVSMPVAVYFGQSPRYDAPRDGQGAYTESIREIFPRELQDRAFEPTDRDRAAMDEVDRRIAARGMN